MSINEKAIEAAAESKAVQRVRQLLANNGRNSANGNVGIPVGSHLHFCEMLLGELDAANAKLAALPLHEDAVEAAGRRLFAHGSDHGWWAKDLTFDLLDPIGREEFDAIVSDVLAAAPPAPVHTDHSVPCPTCGFRIVKRERAPFVIEDGDSALIAEKDAKS